MMRKKTRKERSPDITEEQEEEWTKLHLDEGVLISTIAKKVEYNNVAVSRAIGRYIKSGRRVLKG